MVRLGAQVSSLPLWGQAHSRPSENRAGALETNCITLGKHLPLSLSYLGPLPPLSLSGQPPGLTSLSPSLEPDSWDRRLRSHKERLGRAGGPLGVRVRWTLLRISLSAGPGIAEVSSVSPWKTRQAARR